MFKLEIKEEAEAETLISQNLTCHIASILYKLEEFLSSISVQQCWHCLYYEMSVQKTILLSSFHVQVIIQ